jgi:hypothetical protein
MGMDQEWQKVLNEALNKLETIGFFAAIGIHFAESTPLLSEDLGEHIKGTPWERFSSTDQCLKMIHQLATQVWHNLEGIASAVDTNVIEKKELVKEIIEPEASKDVTKRTPYFQGIDGDVRLLKTMGESIISMAGHGKQDLELDHEQIKTLGEMVINVITTINEKLQEQREKVNTASSEDEGMKGHMGKPLQLIGEDLNQIKAFGSCLVAMGMAFHDGFKLNPRQIETLGQMIVDLAEKVKEKLNQTDSRPPSFPLG